MPGGAPELSSSESLRARGVNSQHGVVWEASSELPLGGLFSLPSLGKECPTSCPLLGSEWRGSGGLAIRLVGVGNGMHSRPTQSPADHKMLSKGAELAVQRGAGFP